MGRSVTTLLTFVVALGAVFEIYGRLVEWGWVPKPQGPYAVHQQPQADRSQPTTPSVAREVPVPQPTVTVQVPPESAPLTDALTMTATSLHSLPGGAPTQVEFVNESGRPVKVFWMDYQGHERCYFGLAPGQSHIQPTYALHPWRVRDAFEGKLLAETVASEAGQRVVIPSRPLGLPVIWPIGMPVTCGDSRS